MHFVMSVFSNHAVVLHNVMPIDGRIYKSTPTTQSAVLSDGVVVKGLHKLNRRFYFSAALQTDLFPKFSINAKVVFPDKPAKFHSFIHSVRIGLSLAKCIRKSNSTKTNFLGGTNNGVTSQVKVCQHNIDLKNFHAYLSRWSLFYRHLMLRATSYTNSLGEKHFAVL